MHVDFLDLFIHCGLDSREKSGKMLCPFCGKYAFVAYDDAKAYCHNCKFSGNAVTFYAEIKHIPYNDALKELIADFGDGKIKLHKLSKEEALKQLREDLHFLAMVRMYFQFYRNDRENKKYYQQLSGMPASTFSRIINGDIASTSRFEWNKALLFLRSRINIKKFTSDFEKGAMYFNDEAYELLKTQSHKY